MKRNPALSVAVLILAACAVAALAQFAPLVTLAQRALLFAAPPTASAPVQRQTSVRTNAGTPRHYEDFDIRAAHQRALEQSPQVAASTARLERTNAIAEFQQLHPRAVLRWSSLTNTPSRIIAQAEALTTRSNDEAETIARRFLSQELFQLDSTDANALRLAGRDHTAHNGVTHITLQQRLNDIEVFGTRMTVHLNRAGEVFAAHGELIPNAAQTATTTRPQLAGNAALELAAASVGLNVKAASPATLESTALAQPQTFARTPELARAANTRLVYFPLAANQLVLAWEVEVWPADTPDAYLTIIDAARGSLLFRRNLTCYEAPHGLVYTDDSPRPDNPHTTNNPPVMERADVPFRPAPFNGITLFGAQDRHTDWWNGKPATNLSGNNVDAHLDRDSNDQPDTPILQAPDSSFSFPLDLTKAPTTADNQKAAQANLFYWTNRFHDILYAFGFTESAGNFQTDNFGLGGQGNDAVQADVQDGSEFNNANFTTPPDGRPGRVQMFLWNNPGLRVQLDGSLDQTIILHELAHGVSNRLIGNGLGLGGMQARGMGEGWSDYLALALLAKESDPLDGQYFVAQYATNKYAAGIRFFPYSTDIKVSPLTYQYIWFTRAPHPVGEIWGETLWDMRALLLKQYGFREGQRQSIQLVLDGMKLTPIEPTFLEARDAILLADRVNNNGANQCLLWQAFAKRGLGLSARTFETNDPRPTESFDLPPYCSDTATLKLDKPTYVDGEVVNISLGDRNATAPVQVQVSSSATGDQETVTLTPDAVQQGSFKGTIKLAAASKQANDGVLQAAVTAKDEIVVRYRDSRTDSGTSADIQTTAQLVREKVIFSDDGESGNQGWLATGTWSLTAEKAASGTRAWSDSPGSNYANLSQATLTSPLFDLRGLSAVQVQFAHAHEFENRYDYGVIDCSTDDGVTWISVGAYTGTQRSFAPAAMKLPVLDGQQFARFRFRLFSDLAVNGDGWYLDDIRLLGRSADAEVIAPGSQAAPTLIGLNPAYGGLQGGTLVTITGANFTETADTTVTFDGRAAQFLQVISNNTLTVLTPPHAAGAVAVRILNRNGGSSLNQGFTYWTGEPLLKRPSITRVAPNSGPIRGGTLVTITGNDFTPATTLAFGNKLVTPTFISPQELRVSSPSATTTGTVNFLLSNGNFSNVWENAFTYSNTQPPQVELLSPTGTSVLYLGSRIAIRWGSSDDRGLAAHRLALLGTDGKLITEIANDIGGERQAYVWQLPTTLPVGRVRLRLTARDTDGNETETISPDITLARRWEAGTPLPEVRWQFPLTTDGKALYAFRGFTATPSGATFRFDPATNAWTTLAPLPLAVGATRAIHLNGKIYLPGGAMDSGLVITNHQVYDIATNTWSEALEPPLSTKWFAAVADEANQRYYRIAGRRQSAIQVAYPDVMVYDAKANAWTQVADLPEARYGHEAALISGRIYVAGGSGTTEALTSCYAYDPGKDEWTEIARLKKPRRFATSTVGTDAQGNSLWFLFGGENPNTGVPLDDAEVYDVRKNQWITLDDSFRLSKSRTQLSGATLKGTFYAVGGATLSNDGRAYLLAAQTETLSLQNLIVVSPDQPPALAAPTAAVALINNESTFVVTANDLGSGVALDLKAEGLPATAEFIVTPETNNSTRGTFRWTPTAADAGKTWRITFTVSDGQLEDARTTTLRVVAAESLAVVNAASYYGGGVAANSIATAFGARLALRTEAAQAIPLPLTMAGTSVTVNGVPAQLLYVADNQINFVVPSEVKPGVASVVVSNPLGTFALGHIPITDAAPAIFTADASGRGDAAAVATADGINYQPSPFALTINGKPNYLLLFGTGLRRAANANADDANGIAESVAVTIGGVAAKVLYAGAQGQYVGLDQLNIELPVALAAQVTAVPSRFEVIVTVNGQAANRTSVWLKNAP